MLTSVAIKVSVRCPECTSQVPLNGLHTRASCPACQTAFDVVDDLAWWEQEEVYGCLGAVLDAASPEELPYDSYSDEAQLVFLRQDPPCPGCGRQIPTAELAVALEQGGAGAGACACSCGGSLQLRPADPAWCETMPWLRGLAGEAPAAVIQQRPGQAIAITCPACGGELTPVAGQHAARCGYCGTSSATPDPGAPARQREWFYLIVDPDEKTALYWSLLGRDGAEVEKLAADPSTPPLQLEALARCGVATVAANPSTPASTLLLLARGEDSSVREEVAKNKSTPGGALVVLASDEESDVREALAERSDLPLEALELLARDCSEYVRRGVADKGGLTEELLCGLAADPEHSVQEAAVRNPALTPAVLDVLAQSTESHVRRAVARHKLTTPETLVKLGADEDEETRENVARNHATPADVLARLASSPRSEYDRVTEAARKNPSCPKKPLWKKLF